MVVQSYQMTCTFNAPIARDVHEVRFKRPKEFTFKPGQFVLMDTPLVENPADIQPRAYSIASTPADDEVLLIFRLTPGGRASRFIVEVLRPGMAVTMKGAFGFFTLNPEKDKDYLFIATSTGVAPFRSQVQSLVASNDKRTVDLVFGVRSEEDLFWYDELVKLSQLHPQLSLHMTLTQPTGDWKGHTGRVQTIVPKIVRDFTSKTLFACGSPAMTKEVKELALTHWGMAKQDLHVEGYI